MKRWLAEPLLHFLLLGAALFAGYRLVHREPARDPQAIVVSAGEIENLHTGFLHTWQRPPTAAESKALIDGFLREEVLSREAVKLGLDRNDAIIRRRLQQKMEFVAEDMSAATEPTEAELASYLAEHAESFRDDARFTFRQVFLSPEKRGDQTDADALRLLAELKAGAAADALGDATLLPPAVADEPLRRIESSIGKDFSAALATLPVGTWSGPLRSSLGVHLVLVEKRSEGRVPPLAEVRAAVQREWENARHTVARGKFFDTLLSQYRVTVEWPSAPGALAWKK